MNCSQFMAGFVFCGAAGAGFDDAGITGISGGAIMGFGVRTGLGDGVAGGAAIFTGGTGTGATGGADSRPRFNREISDSSSLTRKKSSSTRLRALTARTTNQTARAKGIPRTAKTMMGIISINFAFRPTIRLGCAQCVLRRKRVASCNDAALNHLFGSFSRHQNTRWLSAELIEKKLLVYKKIN
jgi:hypothetical protein